MRRRRRREEEVCCLSERYVIRVSSKVGFDWLLCVQSVVIPDWK